MNIIEVKNLNKSYGDFHLKNINLTLPHGAILGLVGENGAGKSTLIKLILGSLRKDGGYISVLGEDNDTAEFISLKQNIGVVLDEAYFPEMLNAKEIEKIMKLTYNNWDGELFINYLEKFSLPLLKKFKDYSRGMKMKLSIAVALSHSAKLLIFDEATGGLDPLVRDEILDILSDFTTDENHAVLLSSHIVSDLEKVCDYIAFIHKGELLLFEEKDAILEKYAILKLSHEHAQSISEDAIISRSISPYGCELFVYKDEVPHGFSPEHSTLEDIIVLLSKEGIK